MKIKVKKDKAQCEVCRKFVKMEWNELLKVYEITCCGKTISIYKKKTISKPRKKRKAKK